LCSCFFLLLICIRPLSIFFFIYPVPSHIYTLSLHDALPISFGEGLFSCRCCERDRFSNINCCKNGTWYSKSYLVNGKSGPKYGIDRKSTRLNSSHVSISYAVFCLKKKKKQPQLLTIKQHNEN